MKKIAIFHQYLVISKRALCDSSASCAVISGICLSVSKQAYSWPTLGIFRPSFTWIRETGRTDSEYAECCNTLWIICGTSHAELSGIINNLHCDICTTLTELYINEQLNVFCQSTYYLYYTETKLRWINYYECNVLCVQTYEKNKRARNFWLFCIF